MVFIYLSLFVIECICVRVGIRETSTLHRVTENKSVTSLSGINSREGHTLPLDEAKTLQCVQGPRGSVHLTSSSLPCRHTELLFSRSSASLSPVFGRAFIPFVLLSVWLTIYSLSFRSQPW